MTDWALVSYVVLAIAFQAVAIGGIYALVSGSLTLVWGSVDYLNIALGSFFVLSMYTLYEIYVVLHVNIFFSILLTLGLFLGVHYALDKFLLTRFFKRGGAFVSLLLVAIALLIFNNGFYDTILTYNPRVIETAYSVRTIQILNFRVTEIEVIAIVTEYVLVFGMLYFIRYTRYGKILRAMVQDGETASLMGADLSKLRSIAYLVSAVVVTLGGLLYGLLYSFDPTLVSTITIPMVVIALVGGIGSIFGSTVMSLVFGAAVALVSFLTNPVVSVYVFYVIMFLILFIRPRGLFKR